MAATAKTIRVFVSSTFSDLKAERNALQAYVFPRLRELCEQHGARFQPIDLRWGVSDEASLDQQAMNICLGEIERCRQISPRPTSSSCWATATVGCRRLPRSRKRNTSRSRE